MIVIATIVFRRIVWSRGLARRVLSAAAGLLFAAPAAAQQEVQLAAAGPRFLSSPSPGTPAVDVRDAPALQRRVTFEFDRVPLRAALAELTRQTGLKVVAAEELVPLDRPMSVHADGITVGAALFELLVGTGLDVHLSRDGGSLSLVPRAVPSAPSGGRRQPGQTGTVTGRVKDASTGRPIAYATVLLDGLGRTATTGDSGTFRLSDVPVGMYTVVARLLGYTPLRRPVTVTQGRTVTMDIALEKSPSPLDRVVVAGTLVPTEVKAIPTPVSVITSTDIELQQPHTTLEVIRQAVPSAVAWDLPTDPQQTTISVRGASSLSLGAGSLKVYLDGIEIADRSAAAIDPYSIDHIEVIRGPEAATLYGAEAVGGVMLVFTKHGDSTRSRPEVSVQSMLGVVQSAYAGYSGALRQDHRASILGGTGAASYNIGLGYAQTGAWVREGQSTIPSAYGGVHLGQGAVALDLSARYYAQKTPETGNPFLGAVWSYYAKPFYNEVTTEEETFGVHLTYAPTSRWRNNVTVGIDQFPFNGRQLQPRLTYAADTERVVYSGAEAKTSIAYNTSAQVALGAGWAGTVTAGVDGYSASNYAYYDFAALTTTGSIQEDPTIPASTNRAIVTDIGYFGQVQVNVHDAVFLTAGVRADHNSAFGSALGTPVSPRFGVSSVYGIGDATVKARASYGEAILPPTPGESEAAYLGGGSRQLASPRLGPERQRGWDGGLDVTVRAASLGVTYYDQMALGLIAPVYVDTTGLLLQIQNVGRVRNSGVELEGALRIGLAQFRAQYAYTRSRIENLGARYTGDAHVGDQVVGVPRYTGGGSVALSLFPRTHLSGGLTYVGSWVGYDYFAELGCFGGTRPCASSTRGYYMSYPSFVKANCALTEDLTTELSAVVSVDNVTNNQAYELFNSTPVMGRITMIGLRFHW